MSPIQAGSVSVTQAAPESGLHPDRLLPADPEVRPIARRIHDEVRGMPIISPHGHVNPRLLLDDAPFPDPATLFVTPDHYVTRLLHADGVGLDQLGVGQGPLDEDAARAVWRRLCERWHLFPGTPVGVWLENEPAGRFHVRPRPAGPTAHGVYHEGAPRLRGDAHPPRPPSRR